MSEQGTRATVNVKNGENCDRTDPSTLQFPRWPAVFPGPPHEGRAHRSDEGLGSRLGSAGGCVPRLPRYGKVKAAITLHLP